MTFLNWSILAGLAAVTIPIIIHLLNRRKAQVVDWGAMQFLLGSLVSRNRRVLIEEMLLLALRCLLLALLALAMARPFVPAGSRLPWGVLLPAALLAAAALGTGTALWRERRWRWTLYGIAALLLGLAAASTAAEHWLQLRRWASAGGEQDVAIIIDGSDSMTLTVDGRTNFERAVDEARSLVRALPRNDAVGVILGGPKPVLAVPVPSIDRAEVLSALDRLRPAGGHLAVLDALHAAGISLAEGQNTTKKIVLLTDEHSVGWEPSNRVRWEFLGAALKDLPSPPRIVCRTLTLPKDFRNAALADLTLSRDVVGLDRPVAVQLQVENTGNQPLAPFDVEVRVDGKAVATRPVSALGPGAVERIRVAHQFDRPGLHVIAARCAVRDDLPADDLRAHTVRVLRRLPVLIVDGNPTDRPFDRGSWYIDIALAPGTLRDAGGSGTSEQDKEAALVATTIVNAPDLPGNFDFSPYGVVVLAGVPQLRERVAQQLAEFVYQGGGLLVAPGDQAVPTFYNEWRTSSGLLISPARFGERHVLGEPDAPVKPALTTFTQGPFAFLADEAQSDIGAAAIRAFWRLQLPESALPSTLSATLETGDPFVVEHQVGKGRVLLSSVPLDISSSNLPTLQCFVPLVHEIVYHLVQPARTEWNFEPANELQIDIESELQGKELPAGRGLKGEYYDGHDWRSLKTSRVDPEINFNWPDRPAPGVPADNFAVRWTGSVVPRFTEPYTFFLCADDRAQLWIDGAPLATSVNQQEQSGTVALKAGRRHDIRFEFFEGSGLATVYLAWSSRSQPREVVPARCLLPFRTRGPEPGESRELQVSTPDGTTRRALLAQDGDALSIRVRNAIQPGLYRVRTPESLRGALEHLLDAEGALPFTVRAAPEESRLTPLAATDFDALAQRVNLFHAQSPEQVLAAISGGVPGSELWKYLALAALAAVLAEVLLTHWIARQRRTGSVETVAFTSEAVDPAAYRERTRRLLDPRPPAPET